MKEGRYYVRAKYGQQRAVRVNVKHRSDFLEVARVGYVESCEYMLLHPTAVECMIELWDSIRKRVIDSCVINDGKTVSLSYSVIVDEAGLRQKRS